MTATPAAALIAGKVGVGSRGYRILFHLTATTGFTLAAYDRHVFGVLLEAIKADLGLSDTMLGLLQGFAFAICYATAAVPVAYLIDKQSRVRVATWCITIWSLGTACCALASGLAGLAAGRTITAISEAGYSPAALSLISDTMARRNVPRATSLYLIAPSLGLGLAFIGGGSLLRHFTSSGGLRLPIIGLLSPWQSVLVLSATPGLVLAILIACVFREPPRRGSIKLDIDREFLRSQPDESTFKKVMAEHGAFLIPYIAGCTAILLVLFTLAAWGTSLTARAFRIDPADAASVIGPATLIGGIAGPVAASLMLGKLQGRDVLLRMTTISIGSAAAASLLLPTLLFVERVQQMMIVFGLLVSFVSTVAPMIVSPIQILIPSAFRGRFHAGATFMFTVVAGGVGPGSVGLMMDYVFQGTHGLERAIVFTCGLSSTVGVLFILKARRALQRR